MTQFGAGAQLADQCPQAPTPDGWRVWVITSDGPVPDALVTRATALATDTSVPLGTTESYPLPGVTTLIRVEPQTWGKDQAGALVRGCFRGSSVYLPVAPVPTPGSVTPPTEPDSRLTHTVNVLTAVSLAVGTVATIASLKGK